MTKPVRLAREARAELHEAARRYGEVRPELRAEVLAAIDEAMERLVRMAHHLVSTRQAVRSPGWERRRQVAFTQAEFSTEAAISA